MKKRIWLCYALSVCVCCVLGAPVKMIVLGLDKLPKATQDSVQKVPKIIVKSLDKKVDARTFIFTKRRNFKKNDTATHLQGFVIMRGKKYPAGATKINNTLQITHAARSRNRRQRMNTLTVPVAAVESIARLKSVPSSALQHTACGAKHEMHVHSHTVMPLKEGLPQNTAFFATLHTYADTQFYAKYGEETNTKILSDINIVESIYTSQLGVRFNIVGQTILSTTDETTDPGYVLSNFRNEIHAQKTDDADLKHLFTGKDMRSATSAAVGIAYIGALCYAPNYAYGVSQDFLNLTWLIFAHELGHNFGANHTTEYGSIMYPSISPYAQGFSDDSVNSINRHLSAFGSCLDFGTYGPNLQKATLTIRRKNKRLSGTLTDEFGVALQNQKIILNVNGKTFEKITNELGVYRHYLKLKRKPRKFLVFSSTANSETLSRKLRFKL